MTKKDYIYISIIIVLVVGFFLYTKDLREREATCSKTFEIIWDEVQKENKNN